MESDPLSSFGPSEWRCFSIAPLVLALLAVKWLYESKKSLAEIATTLKELKADAAAGKSSMENEYE